MKHGSRPPPCGRVWKFFGRCFPWFPWIFCGQAQANNPRHRSHCAQLPMYFQVPGNQMAIWQSCVVELEREGGSPLGKVWVENSGESTAETSLKEKKMDFVWSYAKCVTSKLNPVLEVGKNQMSWNKGPEELSEVRHLASRISKPPSPLKTSLHAQ